jgi:hypothetical protein
MQRILSVKPDYRALAMVIWATACASAVLAFLPVTTEGGRLERVFDAIACPALLYIGHRMYRAEEGERPSLYHWIVWSAALVIFVYGLAVGL